MSFKNTEVRDLAQRLEQSGPEWTRRVAESNGNWEIVRGSLGDIDTLLSEYRSIVNSHFSTAEIDKINSAISLVFEEQGLALRKDAKLYPIHPLEVSYNIVRDLSCTHVDLVVGGLLHDIIEDVKSYADHPERIGQQFGEDVQEIVQAMTNKWMPKSERKEYAGRMQGLGYDDQTTRAILGNIDYYIGVKEKLEDPRVLIVKSYDFRDNAFRLSNLDSNRAMQSRLANKYLPLIDVFVSRFADLAGRAGEFGVSAEGVRKLATKFMEARAKVDGYARQWQHYSSQSESFALLNLS